MAWIRRELNALGIPPLKRLGQHFLVDKSVRDQLIHIAALAPSDTVLEVGPGLGFLTTALTEMAGRVIAIEKDRTLAKYLREKFSNRKNLTVIQGDALKAEIPANSKIVSSPPYNISSKLILLALGSQFKLAALLLQEEFVRRLTAASGTPEFGRLTVMVQSRVRTEYVAKVPRTAFYPKPRVDSALVTITRTAEEPLVRDRALFADLVRALFTQRRRELRGVLTRYLKKAYPERYEAILRRAFVPEKRVFQTTPRELVNLSNDIASSLAEM